MRLSHLTAVATLVALLGAMFVAMGSAGAADPPLTPAIQKAVGDVSANMGVCMDATATDDPATNNDAYVVATDGTTAPVENDDGTANLNDGVRVVKTAENPATDATEFAETFIRCTQSAHNKNVKIIPNGTASPIVEVQNASIRISLGDTDNTLSDDRNLSVSISLQNFAGAKADAGTPTIPALDYVRVSGELEDATNSDPNAIPATELNLTGSSWSGTIEIPDGTTPGEYTVSTRVSFDHDDNTATTDRRVSQSATFTVGEGGIGASGASLTLANARDDEPRRVGDSSVLETGSDSAVGGEVWLRLFATNSLGGPSNPGDLSSVTVIAAGAKITIHDATWNSALGALVRNSARNTGDDAMGDNSASISTIHPAFGHTTFIKIEKSGSPPKPGSVDVYAIVIGKDGSATSETLTMSFTGSGTTLELGDAKAVSPGNQTEFGISALDSGGSKAGVSQISFKVTDSDGKRAEGKLDVEMSTVGKSTATPLDDNPNAKAGLVSTKATTPPGVYTVEVSIPGVAGSSATTEVIVAGAANAVELAADPESGDAAEQDVIKVTATVTDKNGANVADGTRVEFTVLGRSLSAIGPGHASIETSVQKALDSNDEVIELSVTSGGVKTKDGQASANYVVTGSGTAVISATSEGGSASGVLRVATTDSAAEAADAMPEEEASVSCLSELSGFATWSCGVEADASEIFDMVSGRGVTALHLWNGSTWVRYSVVDGAMVPGSSDFMVTENDILYISN